jgi:AcrR family transcriptional regulator
MGTPDQGVVVAAQAAPLRRQPVQQRSAQRVERMLNACAELIAEGGYDALTTTLIAERAGVAVGSLYQFFPDKRAVVQALTLRNLDRFLAAVEERFEAAHLERWQDTIDVIIDVYVWMHRQAPGFSRLHFGDVVDPHLMDKRRDNDTVIAERLVALIAQRFGIPQAELQLPISVAVAAADAVLKLAVRHAPDGDPAVIDEAKHLVRGYLMTRIP